MYIWTRPLPKGRGACQLSNALTCIGAQGNHKNRCIKSKPLLCDPRRTYLVIPIIIVCWFANLTNQAHRVFHMQLGSGVYDEFGECLIRIRKLNETTIGSNICMLHKKHAIDHLMVGVEHEGWCIASCCETVFVGGHRWGRWHKKGGRRRNRWLFG